MSVGELRAEVRIELDYINMVLEELEALRRDVGTSTPTLRERAAAGALLAQFYNGFENILKRISKHHDVPLPERPRWHVELLERYCEPPVDDLPLLFDASLAVEVSRFRSFRHVTRLAYSFQLKWTLLAEGIDRARPVFDDFQSSVNDYLASLE